jgi:N-acetylmuramoyl-L-alanine amidase
VSGRGGAARPGLLKALAAAGLLVLMLLPAGRLTAQEVPLGQLLSELEATLRWSPESGTGYLDLSGTGMGDSGDRIIFCLDSPWMLVNYRDRVRTAGVLRRDGQILFPAATLESLRDYFRARAFRLAQPRVAAIIIDAGHGGKDSGAVGTVEVGKEQRVLYEKDVVLQVAKGLYALLRQHYPEKQILLSRRDDTYLRLEERTELANGVPLQENEAIIFVSIHANAAFNPNAKGYEVWVLPGDYRRELIDAGSLDANARPVAPILNVLLEEEYSIESTRLAKAVLDSFDATVGELTENRGIREESWFVVRKAKMPSILIELGYVTNREEALLLSDSSYLQKLAQGVYTGIRDFVASFENTKGFTEQTLVVP